MESVAVAATLHDTSGLLVDNLDLVVVDHVFNIFLKECVRLEELCDGVHALSFHRIVLH